MADFAAPSFSLGIDFGSDDRLDLPERPSTTIGGAEELIDEDEGFDLGEDRPKEAPLLKRLRRGPAPPRFDGGGVKLPERNDLDDDIEEFSSQEECRLQGDFPSQQYNSLCRSSKLSLHGRKILTTQSSNKANTSNNSCSYNASWSGDLETSGNKKMLPRLTISPIRKIQFLDSDSDDSSHCTWRKSELCQAGICSSASQIAANDKLEAMTVDDNNSYRNLWKDFNTNNVNIATPALDEFCNEYLSSLKDTDSDLGKEDPPCSNTLGVHQKGFASQGSDELDKFGKISRDSVNHWNLSDPHPPAYQYFFHDDMRIRKLVHERLCNFIPLGATSYGQQRFELETFDYMGQFDSEKVHPKPPTSSQKSQKRKSSNRRGIQSAAVANDLPSENWINPRSPATYPKDARRRRVHVQSLSSGHWYTQGGKRVYISKGGEELTGQAAYRCYKRESGCGFRKAKKDRISKKKVKK